MDRREENAETTPGSLFSKGRIRRRVLPRGRMYGDTIRRTTLADISLKKIRNHRGFTRERHEIRDKSKRTQRGRFISIRLDFRFNDQASDFDHTTTTLNTRLSSSCHSYHFPCERKSKVNRVYSTLSSSRDYQTSEGTRCYFSNAQDKHWQCMSRNKVLRKKSAVSH